MQLGTIAYTADNGGQWIVRAAPHVAMRVRRLFNGSKRGKGNEAIISATDSAAFDLETMVRARWTLDLDDTAAERFPAAVNRYRARQAAVEEVLRPDYQPPLPTPLALPLRSYQQVAVDLAAKSGSLLLCDEVGTGKTASSIGTIVASGATPAVVVTMTHLARQWRREFQRFAPHLSVHVISKASPYPLRDLVVTTYDTKTGRRRVVKQGAPRLPDVLILTYSKLAGWSDELLRLDVAAVIFDEAQELRRAESKRYDAARALAEHVRLRLSATATPVYNYGAEIYNVVECTAPGFLGSRTEFLDEWCTHAAFDAKARVADPPALRSYLTENGIMLRRTRRDIGRELPPMQRIWHTVDADERALDAVQDAAAELARMVLAKTGTLQERMHNAGELDWRLRQATGIAKAPAVADFVRMLVESEERVVLFGWHHEVYNIWAARLADLGVAMYTGQVSPAGKEAAVKRFVEGDARVLILSVRAGAGIDGLQHVCRTGVVGELDWSPAVHVQNEGRLARDGQKDPVTFYYLTADDGSDPVIMDTLGVKEEQRVGLTLNPGEQSGVMGSANADDDDRMRRLAETYLARRKR